MFFLVFVFYVVLYYNTDQKVYDASSSRFYAIENKNIINSKKIFKKRSTKILR